VLLPAREDRFVEPPVRDLAVLADAVADGLAPALDRPYALFGHSLGALLAFEVMRRIAARGARLPEVLYASGCEAPTQRLRRPPISGLDTPALLAELAALGGTPPEFFAHRETQELVLPMLRADFHASESYVFAPCDPLTVPLVALVGIDDPEVQLDRAADWQARTCAEFRMQRFPGDHFFFTSAAVLDFIAAGLTAMLAHLP
jgi:medium-chain acyl-[acyl-carrier-protein] hydrolase